MDPVFYRSLNYTFALEYTQLRKRELFFQTRLLTSFKKDQRNQTFYYKEIGE